MIMVTVRSQTLIMTDVINARNRWIRRAFNDGLNTKTVSNIFEVSLRCARRLKADFPASNSIDNKLD